MLVKNFFLFLVSCYSYIFSPFIPISCRFYPTCSCYAREAIIKYNIFYAIFLIFLRLLKCNPFFKGGLDLIK